MPEQTNAGKRPLCVGLIAHVDAGKTTLSEAMLYLSGAKRTLGRVDHADAALDTDPLERARGITIFSKQARLSWKEQSMVLVDTPGHADLTAETERTLQVLDCAVLVISGTDGIQSHTLTLWHLLERYGVPVLLFVNKTDLPGFDREQVLAELRRRLSPGCVPMDLPPAALEEAAALCDDSLLEQFLAGSPVTDGNLRGLFAARKLYPVCFGSALRLTGVEPMLDTLTRLAPEKSAGADFGALVYKISRDAQGTRLTWLRVTGGSLRVRMPISYANAQGEILSEKPQQLRLYSGEKFTAVEEVSTGNLAAVTGLTATWAGQALGAQAPVLPPLTEPVMTYRVALPAGMEVAAALPKLRLLEEEEPLLHLVPEGDKLHVQIMGRVQQEVFVSLARDRLGLEVQLADRRIFYKETIRNQVEGVGHFEPLRHYAEVHLLLEPLPRGRGLEFDTVCPTDVLDGNYQSLILTHLREKVHRGVLTGAPITDMKLTLLVGKAHPKHTEGGDFRQATYRAVRHGLMQAESVLLEPWYRFRLEVPSGQVGRAMTDLQQMGGKVDAPETMGEETSLTGTAPVAGLRDYARDVAVYTRGRGRLSCIPAGYFPCMEADRVIEAIGYDPERDVENTADSVFCSHGAGVVVPWNEVPQHAQVDSGWRPDCAEPERKQAEPRQRAVSTYAGTAAQDRELQAIFERTYGAVKRREFIPPKAPRRPAADNSEETRRALKKAFSGEDYLLVDGYNIIFAWDELKKIAAEHLDAARKKLCDLLCDYQGCRKCRVILVFDAYKVKGGLGSVEKYHNITIVYTKEAETADAYIERATYEIGRQHRVRVATSDGPEQVIILGHGALRLSASAFHEEMTEVRKQIGDAVWQNNQKNIKTGAVRAALEKAKEDGGC